MNKYQTNNKRGGVSPSLRPPSPRIGQVPVRHNIRPLVPNNDIDRELLSQSADFDGPDIEIQSILSTKDQSIIHDLVLAQKQDRYLSSVLNDTNDDDQEEEEENIENDHEVVIGDGTSDKTDLTSFSGLIFDNKDIDIDTKAEEITNILDAMSDQSLRFILESITKEMEKRKVTASAILNGVSTAARAGLEGNINYNAPKTGRRPSLENGERKASPSQNKKTYVKTNLNSKPNNVGLLNSVKKATGNNAGSINKTLTQKIPNKSKTTVVGISKKPTPIKGTSINIKDLQEESRECDFDEELRQINISPTLRTSFDGLPLPDKNKNQQQKVNNRHGAAHPNEKMFKTGPRYNPSPPTTTVPKSRDFPSVITEALNFFSGKKPKSKKEKEDEDFILVEAIKAKNARRVDNIVNSIVMLSDDESSNGLSSFSVSKSTAFDDRSVGSFSSKMSAK